MAHSDATQHALLEQRVDNMEALIVQLVQTNRNIDESLQRLVALEVRHDQTRDTLSRIGLRCDDHDTRISDIEKSKQLWTMSSQALWIGLLAAFGMMFSYMWQENMRKNKALDEYRDNIINEQVRDKSK